MTLCSQPLYNVRTFSQCKDCDLARPHYCDFCRFDAVFQNHIKLKLQTIKPSECSTVSPEKEMTSIKKVMKFFLQES